MHLYAPYFVGEYCFLHVRMSVHPPVTPALSELIHS